MLYPIMFIQISSLIAYHAELIDWKGGRWRYRGCRRDANGSGGFKNCGMDLGYGRCRGGSKISSNFRVVDVVLKCEYYLSIRVAHTMMASSTMCEVRNIIMETVDFE